MITLSDFQRYESLEHELKQFLFERCKEYGEARNWDDKDVPHFEEEFDCWEFEGLYIIVFFEEYRTYGCESNNYSYKLPLDILFDPDFKELMHGRYLEEIKQMQLKLIEERKKKEAEAEREKEAKRLEEIKMLHELMSKYPEEIK